MHSQHGKDMKNDFCLDLCVARKQIYTFKRKQRKISLISDMFIINLSRSMVKLLVHATLILLLFFLWNGVRKASRGSCGFNNCGNTCF